MKSGPHLKGCTVSPRFRRAASTESVTVVLPTALAGPAITKALFRTGPSRMARSLAILLSPAFKKDQILKRDPWQPSGNFQFRTRKKLAYIAQTQISDRNDVLWNLQKSHEMGRLKDTHPSNPDAFATSRQPQILDGTAGAVDIRFANSVSSQDVRSIS